MRIRWRQKQNKNSLGYLLGLGYYSTHELRNRVQLLKQSYVLRRQRENSNMSHLEMNKTVNYEFAMWNNRIKKKAHSVTSTGEHDLFKRVQLRRMTVAEPTVRAVSTYFGEKPFDFCEVWGRNAIDWFLCSKRVPFQLCIDRRILALP